MSIDYRFATANDGALLAPLNKQLIEDEGHRNTMSVEQLQHRMAGWLAAEYQAVIFYESHVAVGYALFRRDSEQEIYLRQLFVSRDHRRRGIGRAALQWLKTNAWPTAKRVRADVLIHNTAALAFWRAAGFSDYCLTLETTL